jgi:hypothetical protein
MVLAHTHNSDRALSFGNSAKEHSGYHIALIQNSQNYST